MSCELTLMLGSTNRLVVKNVRDWNNAPIVGATGTVTLFDKRTHVALTGQVWPVSLTWDATSKTYRAIFASTLVVSKRQFLTAEIRLDSGGGFIYYDDPEIQVSTPSSA